MIGFLRRSAIGLLALASLTAPAIAQSTTEAPGWCEFARELLRQRDGSPFDCARATRCIKLNNYGCSQNHTNTPFPGQLTTPDGRPLRDAQRHAIYEHPKWSLQKSIRTLLDYQRRGLSTPLAIAERYAPWCDTRGSRIQNGPWGRTCIDGLPSVGPSFAGPRCAKPDAGRTPSAQQCTHCNCPNRVAAFHSQGTTTDISDRIELFDANSKPMPAMQKYLTQVFILETGFVPSERLVAEAVASFDP